MTRHGLHGVNGQLVVGCVTVVHRLAADSACPLVSVVDVKVTARSSESVIYIPAKVSQCFLPTNMYKYIYIYILWFIVHIKAHKVIKTAYHIINNM